MDKNIKAVFDDLCGSLKIDINLIKKIERYRLAFVSKNPDHAEFFGGNLTGVHVVRFTDTDRNQWFSEILETDERDLEDRCFALIDPTFYQVAGDVMNQSCVWLAHSLSRDDKLTDRQKLDGMISIFQVMQYKFLTSRMFRHWKYPASRETAEATLAALSGKYAIKAEGSWNNVLRKRSEELSDLKRGIHRETILKMGIDIAKTGPSVAYLINDTQGRIRDMLKNIYNVFLGIHQSGTRIGTTGNSIVGLDGAEHLKDKTKGMAIYKRYISSILPDEKSFIKTELVDIIIRSNPTMPEHMFTQTLKWMSQNYGQRNSGNLQETIDKLMTHVIGYLQENKDVMKNKQDVIGLLTHFKGIYTASRATDELVLEVRSNLEKIVTLATGNRSVNNIPPTRTGLVLYILLRTFTMSHYA